MFIMKGKYNQALIMLNEDEIEKETKSQVQNFLNHPAFQKTHIAIMPDCHSGKGSCIGFTMKMNDYIIPNIVGVDIGCGVSSIKIDKDEIGDLLYLDNFIKENIPSGFNVRKEGYFGNTFNKTVFVDKLKQVCDKTDQDLSYVLRSIGTLGGGNHFIEVGRSDKTDDYWLTVHTGSRNFGLKVASYHQNKAKELMKTMFIDKSEYKDCEFLPMDLGGSEYLEDMQISQEYADLNRNIILGIIIEDYFEIDYDSDKAIHSVHNFISDGIIRKGAISAKEGEQLIIPLNMRDGFILGIGKGSKKWNYSAPHGAGRVLSRTKAKQNLNIDEFKLEMNGIYSSCISESTIDESPMVYKEKELIMNHIQETVEIIDIIKPVYNFKATEG